MKIVETDNFGGDYPNESFLNIPQVPAYHARAIAAAINAAFGDHHHRYWKVVENDYRLVPGFEP